MFVHFDSSLSDVLLRKSHIFSSSLKHIPSNEMMTETRDNPFDIYEAHLPFIVQVFKVSDFPSSAIEFYTTPGVCVRVRCACVARVSVCQ